MSMVARRPLNPMAEMLEWLDSAAPFALRGQGHYIRVEDYIEDNNYVLKAELPGVNPDEDIEVSVEGDLLTISGQRREEEHDKNHNEFRYGSFTRSVRLPPGAKSQEVAATYEDGLLEVKVPIAVGEPASTKIPVQRRAD